MADGKVKQIVDALQALLAGIEGAVTVKVNAPLPEEVPDDGLIVIREGKVESRWRTWREGAGVPVIGVGFGYTDVPIADLKPDRMIDHMRELPAAVEALMLRQNST